MVDIIFGTQAFEHLTKIRSIYYIIKNVRKKK
jgi:hypothetical protein